jgi:hypothetical protein
MGKLRRLRLPLPPVARHAGKTIHTILNLGGTGVFL